MATDIAFGERAIDCVAQSVDADIGIGVARKTLVMWNGHAAQHQGTARLAAHGRRSRCRRAGSGRRSWRAPAGQVLGVGQLDVVLRAGDDRHALSQPPPAAPRHRWRRVGDGTMRRQQYLIAERLRRLSPDTGPRVAQWQQSWLSVTRFSVSATGTAGMASGSTFQRLQEGGDRPRGDQRSCCIVDKDDVRLAPSPEPPVRPARSPGESCRLELLADVRKPISAASIATASPTGCSNATWLPEPRRHGGLPSLPASGANCFGVSAPNRMPVPAATRIAATCIVAHRCRADGPASIGNRHGGVARICLRDTGNGTAGSSIQPRRLLAAFALHPGRRVYNLPN